MAKEIMSIRLSADGLSFWTGLQPGKAAPQEVEEISRVDYPLCTGGRSLEESIREAVSEYTGILAAHGRELPGKKKFFANTVDAVLVPEELFEEDDAGRYMALHGYGPIKGTYIVCSKPIRGTVALMRLPKKAMEVLGKQLGKFSVAHLLQYNLLLGPEDSGDTIRIYLSPTLCHITAWKSGDLKLAEAYPYSSVADVGYFLACITENVGLDGKCRILLRGHNADEAIQGLSRTFRSCICG
ncbi:MAG: DUF3822 family protein [Alistipes sp.]|nr:DUF3822 family protein [Alistipes sp.]